MSTMLMHSNFYDIFGFTVYELNIAEKQAVQRVSSWIPPSKPTADRDYIEVFLRQDKQRKFYKREDYDLVTYLGDLGGLFEFLLGFGLVLASPIVSRLFNAAIVAQVYRI